MDYVYIELPDATLEAAFGDKKKYNPVSLRMECAPGYGLRVLAALGYRGEVKVTNLDSEIPNDERVTTAQL